MSISLLNKFSNTVSFATLADGSICIGRGLEENAVIEIIDSQKRILISDPLPGLYEMEVVGAYVILACSEPESTFSWHPNEGLRRLDYMAHLPGMVLNNNLYTLAEVKGILGFAKVEGTSLSVQRFWSPSELPDGISSVIDGNCLLSGNSKELKCYDEKHCRLKWSCLFDEVLPGSNVSLVGDIVTSGEKLFFLLSEGAASNHHALLCLDSLSGKVINRWLNVPGAPKKAGRNIGVASGERAAIIDTETLVLTEYNLSSLLKPMGLEVRWNQNIFTAAGISFLHLVDFYRAGNLV